MSHEPVELIVAAFQDETGAERALKALAEAKEEHLIGIQNVSVIRRDADNKLHIRETADWNAGKGALAGTLIGGTIGFLFPLDILVTGPLGATIAGMAGTLRDSGFPEAQLSDLRASLKPGTSAIIAVVKEQWVADIEHRLAEHGAKMVCEVVDDNVAAQLEPPTTNDDAAAKTSKKIQTA